MIIVILFLDYRKNVLVLDHMSRGFVISEEEQKKVIPVINVFCILFRHALFCVYDSDFYASNAGMLTSFIVCLIFSDKRSPLINSVL